MPIKIKPEQGRNVPIVICDHCERQIATAAQGCFAHEMKEKPTDLSEIFFLHLDCLDLFEKRHFPVTEKDDFKLMGWIPLKAFPIYLGNVLEIDWNKAREIANDLS